MSTGKIKIALIGCGAISSFHYKALETFDNAEVIGVFDTNIARAKAFADERCIGVFESKESLLLSDADLVTICTPSGLHAPLAIECLDAGKNVVLEKPVAITGEECQMLLEAEKRSHRFCAPISQLRYYDDIRRARSIVESGELGRVVLCDLYMKYYRSDEYFATSTWRGTKAMDGGGALMNQGIHGIDAMRYIVGDVAEISAKVRTLVHNVEVEDTAVASVVFKNGAIGVIEGTTSVRPGYPRRLEIHLEKGSIIVEENTIVSIDTPEGSQKAESKAMNSSSDPLNISYEGHRRQYQNILATIEGKEQLFYTASEAAKTVETILAIYRSSEENKTQYL